MGFAVENASKIEPLRDEMRADEASERPVPRDQWIRSLAGEWSRLWDRTQRTRVLTESR
jgi:hypothetical protein